MTRLTAARLLVALTVVVVGTPPAAAQAPKQITPPLSLPQAQYLKQHPQVLQQLRDKLSQSAQQFVPGIPLAPGQTPAPGSWSTLTHGTPGGVAVQNPLLMTDGTVIAMSAACTGQWYKLTPDITGSYLNGTWTTIATMPSGYAPLFGGSAVLPDGRIVFEGGEYNDPTQSGNCGNGAWTTLGAIYNPTNNTWAAINPPSGWTYVGDAAGEVLDNGIFMQSDCCDTLAASGRSALLNANTLTWTTTGSNKLDRWDEEGMSKLQTGGILDVDAHTNTACTKTAEIYDQLAGTWSATANTIDQEPDCSNPTGSPSYELGPLVVRQDGSAVIFPGLTCADPENGATPSQVTQCQNQQSGFVVSGAADIYNASSGTWVSGPQIPRVGTSPDNYFYSLADAPAAVLPDGNILFAASPTWETFTGPTHFWEMNLSNNSLTQVGDTADANNANNGAYLYNFLLLPTGQVLGVSQGGNIQIYTPLAGSPQPGWAPVITSAPSCVSAGGTYQLAGTQLNGLTEGTYYGDDVQAAVNFPIVRIVNNATGHVFYAKTFNHSTRSIAPGTSVSTSFTVAAGTESGASTIFDVGAGVSSAATPINVSTNCAAMTDTHDFNDDKKSDILWRNVDGDIGIWLMNGSQILQGVTIQNVPNFWSIVGQRDFDGDGDADVLWRDDSGHVGMWLMKGTTLVQGGVIGTAPTSWSIVGTGDFNGDGKADILWRDTSGNVGIWFMNGTTALQTVTVGNLSIDWAVMGADMKGDIFWRNTTTGEFAMWVMNGTTIAQNVSFGLQPLNWSVAGIGDFDGNGSEDILWRDTAGDVAIWLMNGTQFMTSTTFANVPLNWSIAQTGDYDGDGKTDILWLDTAGNVGVWFMNGTTILQGYAFGNVGTNWSVQSLGAD